MDDKTKSPFVSKEEIQRIAEELGITVKFNSPNPGVYNTSTGKHTSLMEEVFGFLREFEIPDIGEE